MNRVRSRRVEAAWWVAGGLLVASLVLLAYLYGRSLLYTGSIISGGATNGIALVALGVAIVAGAVIATARRARVRKAPVLVFALLAAGILVVGGVYFRSDARRYRSEVERQLSIVAELKSSELAQWRLERLGDGSVFLGNAPFAAAVKRWFDHPQDAEAQADLRSWLTRVQAHYLYDRVTLIDARGIERLAVPEGRAPVASVVAPRVRAVLRSGAVTFEDFYRDEHDGRVYLAVLAPIFDERGRALCAVVLRVNPETYLYPLIRRWPTPAQTAETLLVRREGADIVFLNEPKFQKGTTLTLRFRLADVDRPTVMAVRGREGIVEGIDYRGAPVIAALKAVPNSPWFLVARIDAAEADAPLRERLWVILALVGGLLAAAAGGVGVVWREQHVRELKGRYEGEKERAWLHDVVAKSLNEVYVFDPETLRFRFVNRGACGNLGYTPGELAGLTPLDLKPEFTAETFRAMLEPLRAVGRPAHVFETIQRRKDGSEYPVEVHLQLVDSGAGDVFLSVINDITERRQADTQIRRLNRIYAVLSDVNQAIMRVRGRQALFEEACRIAVETGGFKMAWVGLKDTQTNGVRPVAHAGVVDGYLEKLQIDSGDGPRGLGPTGIAVREGRHVVCNDIERGPRMAPWREGALALGYRSSVAFPLKEGEEIVGVFNLYAGEPDFFDEKELRLLDEMAMDLSFAMKVSETEEARLRLATAIEQSPVSVVITDIAGRIEYVNHAFTRITGYTPEEALGGNPRMLKSGKQETALYEEMWATIKAGRSWHAELINQRKDGTLYTQELTVAPVHEATGVTRFVAFGQDVTERKQAGERLRLQGAALSATASAVMITDRTGEIVWVNEAFFVLTGWPVEECVGRTPAILKSGRHDRAFYDKLWRTILAGDVWRSEMVNRRKDGELYVEDQTITPVANQQGEITHFVAIKVDIGERKRAAEVLQSSQERYRALFEESPDGVLILDADTGQVIEANPAASRQLGYTREEFAALRISDYEAKETPEKTGAHIQRILTQGSDNFETLHRTKGGEIRNVHVWAKRIQLDGRVAFHCIFEDITERTRAEARAREHALELIESQRIARLGSYRHDLISGTWTGSAVLDEIFGIVDPAFRRDVPGWLSIVCPDDRQEMASCFAEAVLGRRRAFDREYRIIRLADGEERWVHGLGRLVTNRDGRSVEMIGTIQDITEPKRARLELQTSVSEKVALLKEVHHRVKNNMQVITSLLRLESSRIDHTATRAVLKDMQNRILSMAVLHETLYRSDNFAEVNLGAYLRQLTGQLIRSVAATPGQIELRLDLASVSLNLDQAIPCGLIVNELLSNSLKHGFPAGRSGEVRVELHRVGDEGLRLRVSDNGVGLPPDFETKRKASLGLQLVSDLARQLNGGLVILPGTGASFEVTFIRVDSERI